MNRHTPKPIKSKVSEHNTSDVKGKVVIITGASSGIGKACAFEFTKHGAKVVIASRREDALIHVAEEIRAQGGKIHYIKTDIRRIDDCQNLIAKTIETYGRIDILINNAGLSMRATFEALKLDVIKELMDTNFYGTVYCTKFALPYLLKSKGSIIGISSISGLTPLPGRTGYVASKFAMDGFLNTLRLENQHKGLHIMLVHPGFTNSNIRFTALDKDGHPQAESPRKEHKMMSCEKVATIIFKAVQKRKNNLILTSKGKMIVWLYRKMPRLANRILIHTMAKEPNSPTRQ
ncbi:MAG: SDR family oxidoreductase [Bacteroidales bacterium]|jgi:short-subunit dehydrogenase|nr:SDR family oxidoreductase [Bacteroidales bacterium]